MQKLTFSGLLIIVVITLSGCAKPAIKAGTEVTRFHRNETIAPQAINLEPADEAETGSLEYNAYQDVVATELARLGFEPAEGNDAELIGVVSVNQTLEMQAPKRSPFSIGIGGGSFGSSGGVGVGTSTNVGGTTGGEVTTTTLEVKLVNRAKKAVIWEGRAVRMAEPGGSTRPTAIVRKLAADLFQDFPGQSGKTTTLP